MSYDPNKMAAQMKIPGAGIKVAGRVVENMLTGGCGRKGIGRSWYCWCVTVFS
jgi:hypothetical protein